MRMYKIRYISPLHPSDPSEEGPWNDGSKARARADEVVNEYISVIFQTNDDLARLLLRYADHGEQPLVLDVASEVPVYSPDIEAIALGWVHGDSRKRWRPPEP
jgi:hypothetical protein